MDEGKSAAETALKKYKLKLDDVLVLGKEGLGPALDVAEAALDKFNNEDDLEKRKGMLNEVAVPMKKAVDTIATYTAGIKKSQKMGKGSDTHVKPILTALDDRLGSILNMIDKRSADYAKLRGK